MLFDYILGRFSNDLAIDLGTANTLVYVKGKGIVLNEPSVVAVHKNHHGVKKVLAVGNEAKSMLGRTPGNIVAIRPMRDGVIADFDITEAMLKHFILCVHDRKPWCAPHHCFRCPRDYAGGRRAVRSRRRIGRRPRSLSDRRTDGGGDRFGSAHCRSPISSMVVDIGGGTARKWRSSRCPSIAAKSVRMAGDKIDDEIVQYMKRKYSLLIGERTAELIKTEVGCAYPMAEIKTIDVKGRDLISGIPKTIEVSSDEIREAIIEPVTMIVDTIKDALENAPPELAGDIVDRGIVLTGGGALLKNLDILVREETGLPVTVADDPLSAVARGAGMALDQLDVLKEVTIQV